MSGEVWVYICSNNTKAECLARSLLGDQSPSGNLGRQIQRGDLAFLLNIDSGWLYGVFKVLTDEGNHQPDAWDSKFPYQVEVRPIHGRILAIKGVRTNNGFMYSYGNISVVIGGHRQRLNYETKSALLKIFGEIIKQNLVVKVKTFS